LNEYQICPTHFHCVALAVVVGVAAALRAGNVVGTEPVVAAVRVVFATCVGGTARSVVTAYVVAAKPLLLTLVLLLFLGHLLLQLLLMHLPRNTN
jgi:hypothetical protein